MDRYEIVAQHNGQIIDLGSCYCYDPKSFRRRHNKMRAGYRSDYWGTKSLWIAFAGMILFAVFGFWAYLDGGFWF